MEEAKTIIYLSLAAIAILGQFAGIVAGILLLKYQQTTLIEGQKKIIGVLYDESGGLRFQTKDECGSCRKSCRDEICTYIGKEMGTMASSISRIEKMFDRLHERIDIIDKRVGVDAR